MTAVLGIDLGTQSVKVVAYDFVNKSIAGAGSAPLELHRADGGVAEQRSDWWLAAIQHAITAVESTLRSSVVAVSVSGQQHGFVAIDEADDVLTSVKLWCDTSTSAECAEITEAFGGRDACIDKVGNPIAPGYTASKVRWLKNFKPGLYSQMSGILLPHDYVNLHLTGERCMEVGDASGTGFLDIRRREWSGEMLRAVDQDRDLADCLPPLRKQNEPIGKLRQQVADELGLPAGIPVGIGGGDNMMGAIGTGNVRPGVVTMSLGTSGTVYAYSDEPVIDPKGNIAAFCSSTGGWLPLLCTMNCTVTTELVRSLFNADLDAFESQVAKTPRGSNGVITLPFFNGERTPNLPNAHGCIVGLSSSNVTPGNLIRSALEGATFALRFGIDELATLGVSTQEIVLTGGGAQSDQWRQVVSDVCNLPVTILEQNEGAAFGAAIQALQLVEHGATIEELVADHVTRDVSRSCEPNPASVAEYEDCYEKYLGAVEAVSPMYE
ncbi:MAG: xylulokinase [Woeseiaceae bacterium]